MMRDVTGLLLTICWKCPDYRIIFNGRPLASSYSKVGKWNFPRAASSAKFKARIAAGMAEFWNRLRAAAARRIDSFSAALSPAKRQQRHLGGHANPYREPERPEPAIHI